MDFQWALLYIMEDVIGIILENWFINGSDQEVVACYLELYEEGEVEHINNVWPVFLKQQLCLQLKIKFKNVTIKPTNWPLKAYKGGWERWYVRLHLLHTTLINSMQPLCVLSHLWIVSQKARSLISTVLFVAELLYHKTDCQMVYNKTSEILIQNSSQQP